MYLFPGDDESVPSLRMEKWVSLPFVPVKGMSLGLSPSSTFNEDEHEIRHVIYILESDTFHVELEESRGCLENFARGLVEEGWLPQVFTLKSELSARDVLEDYPGEVLIRTGDGRHLVESRFVAELLTLGGIQFEVLAENTTDE